MALRSNLPEIAAKLDAEVKAAAAAAAELVAERAKERAPYDPAGSGEHLRDAIHTQQTADGTLVVAGDKDVFYGHMVEHGTSHSAPHPFLVPALEESRGEIVDLIAQATRRAT